MAEQLPDFLKGREHLVDFFDDQFNNTEKGTAFELFCKSLVDQIKISGFFEVGEVVIPNISEIQEIELTPPNHDGGVDLKCLDSDGNLIVICQCKFKIRQAKEINTIFEDFKKYEKDLVKKKEGENRARQLSLLGDDNSLGSDNKNSPVFIIFTMSSLRNPKRGLISKFSNSNSTASEFYRELSREDRMFFVDGEDILKILKANFSKVSGKLPDITLNLKQKPIHEKNVYIGVISGYELRNLYEKFGEAIFFENIRLFLGEQKADKQGSESVNQGILKTIRESPEAMLSRNNGVTFKASKIEAYSDNTLSLKSASIINGCQTTMCFVRGLGTKVNYDNSQHESMVLAQEDPLVLVKLVEADEDKSWSIAESANFQNEVLQLDLKLAKYFRPQTVQNAGMYAGTFIDHNNENTPYDILETMTRLKVDYDKTKSTFVGLFSRIPNNSLAADYTLLRTDLLEDFLEKDNSGQSTFESIFLMSQKFDVDYSRYLKKEKLSNDKDDPCYILLERLDSTSGRTGYIPFFNILVACVIAKRNIYDDKNPIKFDEIEPFLSTVISCDESKRYHYYSLCFNAFATQVVDSKVDRAANLKQMYSNVRNVGSGRGFASLFKLASRFCREIEES